MGGNTFSFNTTDNTYNQYPTQSPTALTSNFYSIPVNPKCKCPNPKHTNGCSIEPTGEYCEWCSKGCRKRVMAVHIKYDN